MTAQPEVTRPTTVLVVEDNHSMRELMIMALDRIPNLATVEAENGLDAVELLRGITPDIILTDINMPVMGGLGLLKHIRSQRKLRKTPVIIITTERAAIDRARAMTLGATSYLTKPIQAPKLIAEVRKLLKR